MLVNFSGEAKHEERTNIFFDRNCKKQNNNSGNMNKMKEARWHLREMSSMLVPRVKWTNTGWNRYDSMAYEKL